MSFRIACPANAKIAHFLQVCYQFTGMAVLSLAGECAILRNISPQCKNVFHSVFRKAARNRAHFFLLCGNTGQMRKCRHTRLFHLCGKFNGVVAVCAACSIGNTDKRRVQCRNFLHNFTGMRKADALFRREYFAADGYMSTFQQFIDFHRFILSCSAVLAQS